MYKPTYKLVPGDIVVTHGMRVKLHTGVRLYCYGAQEEEFRWGGSGEVLNPEEAINVHGVPRNWIYENTYTKGGGWTYENPTWFIQGDELTTWQVEG